MMRSSSKIPVILVFILILNRIVPLSGSISPRIVGGAVSRPNSAPYVAYIEIENSAGKLFICTGSLISTIHVLTAAHCLRDRNRARIILGAHDVAIREPSQKDIRVPDSYFILHPYVDIAIINLPTVIQTHMYIQIIKLPVGDALRDYSYEIATTYGWGRIKDNPQLVPTALYEVTVRVLPPYLCELKQGEICTSGEDGKGTCNGDSGGPLVVNGILIGVTSRGNALCEDGHPSYYVSVGALLPWIQQNTNIKFI